MTSKEMTEIFSLMLVAWPNAKVFERGIKELRPTIELWTVCTSDIDFWIAQQATIRLCKECKFPPTIAEFREKVEKVNSEIHERVHLAWNEIRNADLYGHTLQEFYDRHPPDSLTRRAIDAIGGPEALLIPISDKCSKWNYDAWEKAYISLIHQQPTLGGASRPAIGGPKQIGGRQK